MNTKIESSLQDKFTTEIKALLTEGKALLDHIRDEEPANVLPFARRYQTWYTRALGLAKVLAPDRSDEFRRL